MNVVFAIVGMLLIGAMGDMASAGTRVDHVSIRYVPPKNSAHQQIYDQLKHGRALEKLQRFLSPFRLPRTLHISLEECDGEPDAYYDDAAITVCYEYIYELWENMPKESTLAGVTPIDMVIGPLFEITLHEVGHALFDMLNLPVLGREEDAADQVNSLIPYS